MGPLYPKHEEASVHVRQARTSSTHARCRTGTGAARRRASASPTHPRARRRPGLHVGNQSGRPPRRPRSHRHRGGRGPAGGAQAAAAARPRQREGASARRRTRRNLGDPHRRPPRRPRSHHPAPRPLRALDARPARARTGRPSGAQLARRARRVPRIYFRAAHHQQARGHRPHARTRAATRARGRHGRRRIVGSAHERVRHALAHHRLRPHVGHGLRAGLHPAVKLVPGGEQPAEPAVRAGGGRHAGHRVPSGIYVGEEEARARRLQPLRVEPAHHRGAVPRRGVGAVHGIPQRGHLHAKLLLRPERDGPVGVLLPVLRDTDRDVRRHRHRVGPAQREPRLPLVVHRPRGEQRHRHRDVRAIRRRGAAEPGAGALHHRVRQPAGRVRAAGHPAAGAQEERHPHTSPR